LEALPKRVVRVTLPLPSKANVFVRLTLPGSTVVAVTLPARSVVWVVVSVPLPSTRFCR
jgi:hypothetical protein